MRTKDTEAWGNPRAAKRTQTRNWRLYTENISCQYSSKYIRLIEFVVFEQYVKKYSILFSCFKCTLCLGKVWQHIQANLWAASHLLFDMIEATSGATKFTIVRLICCCCYFFLIFFFILLKINNPPPHTNQKQTEVPTIVQSGNREHKYS